MTTTELTTIDQEFRETFGTRIVPVNPGHPGHTINVALAEKTLDLLETKPEVHEQEHWAEHDDNDELCETVATIDQAKELALGACGTSGCFAGWASALNGHAVGTVGELAGVVLDLSVKAGMTIEWHADRDGGGYMDVLGPTVQAEFYAARVLGLDEGQANELFRGSNSRAYLRELLSDWTNGEIAPVRPE